MKAAERLVLWFAITVLVMIVCAARATASDVAGAAPATAIAAEALKADPWVLPPITPAEVTARLAELHAQYAPYLRSLPEKCDVRKREELKDPWRSKFEVTDSTDGKRPAAPAWFGEDFDDSGWETTAVPQWRWSPVKKGRWYPASCILWYRTRFDTGPVPPGARNWLCFAGVAWEAEVWLNGKRLGRHQVYYEPFRFDVTGLLKAKNVLAVRMIAGPAFGEPMAQWSLLPFVPGDLGENQWYLRGDRAKSFPGNEFGTTSTLGSGFGIHREVFLETTQEAHVAEIFARGDPSANTAQITVETQAAAARDLTLEVRLLPENFAGQAYQKSEPIHLPQGAGKHTFSLPMPGAKPWWPAEPYLYRCRAMLRDGQRLVNAHDTLFGMRSFGVVSPRNPHKGLPEGMFLLNGQAVFLRGTNVSGALNAYCYWNEPDTLLQAILLLKVANFNAIRVCQHVSFPEVRELLDRLGMMSEQDQGAGYSDKAHDISPTLAATGTTLARVCYNNPGVVLLSFANETSIDVTDVVANALAVDPERIIIPVSGGTFTLRNPEHGDNLVKDSHPYEAWYHGVHRLWDSARTREPSRLMTMGEYGAEALDAYDTMLHHYPTHWGKPPLPTDDKLWGARQVGKGDDLRQVFGLRGQVPGNLGQYIEASQNYQADVLAEATKGFRLSKQLVGGYFQFHFLDGTAAQWPKSIVSHDLCPKKGYYEMAQVNQPVVPLYRMVEKGNAMEIWGVNDLAIGLPGCTIHWTLQGGEKRIEAESAARDLPAVAAVLFEKIDLTSLPPGSDLLGVALTLTDARGQTLSRYQREVYRSFKYVELGQQKEQANTVRKALHGTPNIALRKPVTATSARDGAAAALAVDGNTRTGWWAADSRLPQSLTVDLGQRTLLRGARLIWEGAAKRTFEIQLSDDGQHWRPVSGKLPESVLLVPRPPLTFRDQYVAFPGGGRYVRITITQVDPDTPANPSGPAGFNELELYAK